MAAEASQSDAGATREVLLCVTGGIAAYKSADLASKLVQAGVGVTAAMSESACRFVQPLTFQTLTNRPVYTNLWTAGENCEIEHISLTERADLMVVAPATANILAKLAAGIADDLISTMGLSAAGACEILVAPAMNHRMWNAPATQANVKILRERGVDFVGPAEGRLACGDEGTGRMAQPADILQRILEKLQ
ncbi:MAG: phosphopantothenoylcysteine decarboxylase [Phycisphaerae bacterium]|nr:phosphopantothenoylcysteine decarboxylase [Phycisphaerae bacterium]